MTTLRALALSLPVVFVLHVLEEAPGFVAWFNSLVTPPITQRSFLAVNGVAFVVTLAVALGVFLGRTPLAALIGVAWVSCLMAANASFHLVATVALGRYSPGVITGVFLYLPLSFLFMRAAARETHVPGVVVAGAALVGALPMLVHGYLILVRGSRLF